MPTRRNLIARAVWPAVHQWIRRSFPDVTQMCVEELAAQLQTSEEPDVILLDVRSIEEYAVSHIPGARRFDDQMSEAELAGLWRADRPIVTYCSIGYRSSAAARRLYSLGYRNVRNLEGSLFRWVLTLKGCRLVCSSWPRIFTSPGCSRRLTLTNRQLNGIQHAHQYHNNLLPARTVSPMDVSLGGV